MLHCQIPTTQIESPCKTISGSTSSAANPMGASRSEFEKEGTWTWPKKNGSLPATPWGWEGAKVGDEFIIPVAHILDLQKHELICLSHPNPTDLLPVACFNTTGKGKATILLNVSEDFKRYTKPSLHHNAFNLTMPLPRVLVPPPYPASLPLPALIALSNARLASRCLALCITHLVSSWCSAG